MKLKRIQPVGKPLSMPEPDEAVIDLTSLDERSFVVEGTFRASTSDGRKASYRVEGSQLVAVALLARPDMTVLELDEALGKTG